MKVNTFPKIKKYRLAYLLVSLALCGYLIYQLIAGVILNFIGNADFQDIINLFSLLFTLLFETSIVLFIIRSLRSHQTLLMKNLVFNRDGTPYKAGLSVICVGGILLTVAAIALLLCAYSGTLLFKLDQQTLLFIADVTLIFGVNLDFTLLYFILFRHEAGAFALI